MVLARTGSCGTPDRREKEERAGRVAKQAGTGVTGRAEVAEQARGCAGGRARGRAGPAGLCSCGKGRRAGLDRKGKMGQVGKG